LAGDNVPRILGGITLIIVGIVIILSSVYDTQPRKHIIIMSIQDESVIKKYLKHLKISEIITGVIFLIIGLVTTLNLLHGALTALVVSFTYALSRLFAYKLDKNIK
jgi:hypothetical protein